MKEKKGGYHIVSMAWLKGSSLFDGIIFIMKIIIKCYVL